MNFKWGSGNDPQEHGSTVVCSIHLRSSQSFLLLSRYHRKFAIADRLSVIAVFLTGYLASTALPIELLKENLKRKDYCSCKFWGKQKTRRRITSLSEKQLAAVARSYTRIASERYKILNFRCKLSCS
ncbi:hypothetical protein L1887_09720 [Cichorium endivia]|nr:hypothetical protein L1887_09720 [Cichorium endivia]